MILIRKANEEDIKKIAEIHVETWRYSYKGIIHRDYLDKFEIENSYNNNLRLLNKEEIYIYLAEFNDNICAFIIFSLNSRGSDFLNYAEIWGLYVLPDYQNKGVGKKLFNEAKQILCKNKIDNLMLWALKDNKDKEFYKKIGGQVAKEAVLNIGEIPYVIEAWTWES